MTQLIGSYELAIGREGPLILMPKAKGSNKEVFFNRRFYMEYQCYHLNGAKKGIIETSDTPFRPGYKSNTILMSSRDQREGEQKGQYYFLINQPEGTYCVASTFNSLALHEGDILQDAKNAGLKPFTG